MTGRSSRCIAPAPAQRVVCLSLHASYRCRHAGACCTSRWPIPVEASLRARLDEALAQRRLQLPAGTPGLFAEAHDLPREFGGLLGLHPSGSCGCYDAGRQRCTIHAQLGHDFLPASCQHFPRVCLIDEQGAFVTLSHYCPTAAGLLFRDDLPLALATAPPGFAPMALEGLDARGALPPLLHPMMLADRAAYRKWERAVVATLGEGGTPEEALALVADATEVLRAWKPGAAPLAEAIDTAWRAASARRTTGVRPRLNRQALALDRLVRAAVPAGVEAPAPLDEAAGAFERWVAPRWTAFARPVGRYLAARAFANWCSYQGRGLRTVVCSLVAALSVLRVEAVRQCEMAGRALDASLLTEAFRAADLLVVHLASREDLARRLSAIEEGEVGEMMEGVGARTRG